MAAGDSEGVLDLERVVCALSELAPGGTRAFTLGGGEWPLRGLVVHCADGVRGYLNRCPHAGHALDLLPGRFLTPDGALLLCSSHGALFEKATGYCIAGPCAGAALTPLALTVHSGFVLLADSVDVSALSAAPP